MKNKASVRKPLPVLHRLIRGMSSEAYHGTEGTWSSSQIKLAVSDEEEFIETYITKTIGKNSSSSFDVGTYLHTTVLEPEKVKDECLVYPGKARRGKDWEIFAKKNKGKVIISVNEKKQVDMMAAAIRKSPVSMKYLVGEAEVSLFIRLVVKDGQIYAPHYNKRLTRQGWVKCLTFNESGGTEFIVKVRADMLGKTFISDVKSTSGVATKKESVRGAVSKYTYDLSAAFYLDLFSLAVPALERFVWIFASKDKPLAAAWRCVPDSILIGRAKWMSGILRMADLKENNWKIKDYLRDCEPQHHERTWIKADEDIKFITTKRRTLDL